MDGAAGRGAPTSSIASIATTAQATTRSASDPASVAWYCLLNSEPIATTRDLSFVDETAPPTATYRVGVGTNWIDDPEAGDVFAFSLPVAVRG